MKNVRFVREHRKIEERCVLINVLLVGNGGYNKDIMIECWGIHCGISIWIWDGTA